MKICPVETTLELITKKWVVQIIRDMLFGKTKFNEFKQDKPELTNKVLSRCLKQMEEYELINKKTNPQNIRDTEYQLTPKGKALDEVIYALAAYGIDTMECTKHINENKEETKKQFKEKLGI